MFYLKVVHSSEKCRHKCKPGMAEKNNIWPDRNSDKMANVPFVTYDSVKECYANCLCLREQRVGMYAQDMSGPKVMTV